MNKNKGREGAGLLEICFDIPGNLPNSHLKMEEMTLGFLGTALLRACIRVIFPFVLESTF